jgi:long-chain acyl-CoA synthetase
MSHKHWLAAYGEKIPCEINPDAHGSVLAMLEAAIERYAEKPAFRSFGHTLTYADVDRLSRNFAAFLQNKLGVKKGERIAVMLPNIAAFPLAMLGIVRAGGVQVNVNPLYTPRELEHQLNDAGVETIVIFNGCSATLAEIIGKTAVKQVISVAPGEGIGAALPAPPVDARLKNVIAFSDGVAQGAQLPFNPAPLTGDDLLFLQYTGGTTGLSKGAALSHRNLVANTEQFKAFLGDALRPGEEVVVTALPLYHIFALMVNFISYFSVGAENWLVANPREMDSFVEILCQARCTALTGVNTLYGGLVMHPKIGDVDFSRLRVAIGGGAAVLPTTSAKWKALRQGHPGRLRPFGDLADPHAQSALDERLLRDRGPAVPVDRHQAARRQRPGSGSRRAGRGVRQGPAGDAGLLAEAAGQHRCLHRRRLFSHRRHRRVRRRGFPENRRPQEGHDHRFRLQRLSQRSGSDRRCLSRGRRMRLCG